MKHVRITFMGLLAAVVLISAQGAWAAGFSGSEGQAFKIGFGESVLITEHGINVTFRDVIEDTRCPSGASCFWEGAVEVELIVYSKSSFAAELVRLRLDSLRPGASRAVLDNGSTIELLRVDPYPSIKEPISLKDYAVTLAVEGRPEDTPLPDN